MAQADWMIPRPSLAAQAQLEYSLRVLQAEGPAECDKVLSIAADLMRQNMHYKTLLNQAIAHITQLEALAALHDRTPALSDSCKAAVDS